MAKRLTVKSAISIRIPLVSVCYFKASEKKNISHCLFSNKFRTLRRCDSKRLDKVTMATRFDSEEKKTGRYARAINIERMRSR